MVKDEIGRWKKCPICGITHFQRLGNICYGCKLDGMSHGMSPRQSKHLKNMKKR